MSQVVSTSSSRIKMKVIGVGGTGFQWGRFLDRKKYKISKEAFEVISSDEYEKIHRLEPYDEHNVVLVRGSELKKYLDVLSPASVTSVTRRLFGEEATANLKAEFALLIREKFTHTDHELNDIDCIVVLHKPIIHPEYGNGFLACYKKDDGLWIDVIFHKFGLKFDEKTVFLFLEE